MTVELTYLAWVATFTAIIWIPCILNMIMVRGLIDAVGYPENPKPLAPWATRMNAAHYNAVENLVVFGALVLVIQLAGLNNDATALACAIYFWARVIHLVSHALAIPWVRTFAFVTGVGSQLTLARQILA